MFQGFGLHSLHQTAHDPNWLHEKQSHQEQGSRGWQLAMCSLWENFCLKSTRRGLQAHVSMIRKRQKQNTCTYFLEETSAARRRPPTIGFERARLNYFRKKCLGTRPQNSTQAWRKIYQNSRQGFGPPHAPIDSCKVFLGFFRGSGPLLTYNNIIPKRGQN